jgi:hypothetical protein
MKLSRSLLEKEQIIQHKDAKEREVKAETELFFFKNILNDLI